MGGKFWLRLAAALSVLAVIATAVSDFFTDFWVDHPMAAAYTSGLLLVVVGIAVVNEYLASRDRRRWTTVAALAVTELRDSSRELTVALAALLGVVPSGGGPGGLREFLRTAEATGQSRALSEVAARRLADGQLAGEVVETIDQCLPAAQLVAARWAPVMVADDTYVDVIDHYVDLLNRVWRVQWALSEDAILDHGKRPPIPAVAAELADVCVDLLDFQHQLTGTIRSLLPWPESFGAPPTAA